MIVGGFCRAAGLPATAVNFGPFAEVGMAASHAASMRGMGLQGLPAHQVSEAFKQAGYAPRHVTAHLLLPQFTKVNTVKGKWALLDDLLTTAVDIHPSYGPAVSAHLPDHMPSPHGTGMSTTVAEGVQVPHMGITEIEQLVRSTAAVVIGEELSSDGRFASSHFDSLAAVELSNSIGKAVGLELPGTLVFDYPSVAEVAKHLGSRLAAQSRGTDTLAHEHALMGVPSPPLAVGPHGKGPDPALMSIKLSHRMPNTVRESIDPRLGTCNGILGDDAISRVPYERWDLESNRAGKSVLRAGFGAFLGDLGAFDAHLFNITGPEADLMDPQQRLLLEASWEVMATSAQSTGAGTDGSMQHDLGQANMGVWIGIQQMEYGNLAAAHLPSMGAFSATGMPFSVAAGRISFTYGLKGPAVRHCLLEDLIDTVIPITSNRCQKISSPSLMCIGMKLDGLQPLATV